MSWVLEMPEFKNWLNAELDSKERLLWICGSAGIGKSIIAGFLIDHLQTSYPNALVAYFFCKRGDMKLMYARSIFRTIAYQCMKKSARVRSTLEACKKENIDLASNIGISTLLEGLLQEPLASFDDEIYIVLDALDEADRATMDVNEDNRSEIDVLIESFAKLRNA